MNEGFCSARGALLAGFLIGGVRAFGTSGVRRSVLLLALLVSSFPEVTLAQLTPHALVVPQYRRVPALMSGMVGWKMLARCPELVGYGGDLPFDDACAEDTRDILFSAVKRLVPMAGKRLNLRIFPQDRKQNGWGMHGDAFPYWRGCFVVKGVCSKSFLVVDYHSPALDHLPHAVVHFFLMKRE